jgi:hypothetical protein
MRKLQTAGKDKEKGQAKKKEKRKYETEQVKRITALSEQDDAEWPKGM